jgi:lipopolysaccharide/colanic/teichoic acid biosynthesis glycosyltransferase
MARRRAFDLTAGTLGCLLAAPVILLLATISLIMFRAWPFFVQWRVGYQGRPFRFVKIRSLSRHAPASADKYALAKVDVSRWGRFLRRTHLDELPQLFLVITGRMSLVGPRPEMPELISRYDPSFVKERTSVRPGCTGLWQVSVDAGSLIAEAPQYDEYYVSHGSTSLDVWILWRTVVCFFGGRTIGLVDVPGFHRHRRLAAITSMPGEPAESGALEVSA